MKDFEEVNIRSSRLVIFAWVLAVVWTLIIATSLGWNVTQVRLNTLEAARIQAQAAFEKDVIYRRWNAEHGGVYALLTERTQPNPYLAVPERDITTPLDRSLTLINPAYMTRQVHELAEEKYGVRGHITSLNPIRPDNAPDPWETEALQTFERGKTEYSSVEMIEGEEYMRLMRPLITEKGCLKCHAAQGYQEGDIRGGISVSVPLEPLWAISRTQMLTLVLGHVLLWLVGLIGVVLGTQRLRQSEKERNKAAEVLQKAKERAEAANKELEAFSYIVSHDLKAPLRGISQLSHWLSTDYQDAFDKEGKEMLTLLSSRVKRMDLLIDGILQYSRVGRKEQKEETIQLNSLVKDIIANLAAPENIEIKILNTLPKYVGDTTRFTQVFQNLISNSIKYIDKPKGKINIACSDEGKYWKFSVDDNGPGIEEKYVEKVFGIFQTLQARDKQEGTGVGLSLVKKIVNFYKGDIWIESKVGVGTTVFFILPKTDMNEKIK